MRFDDGLSNDERAENEVLLQAQVERMRWRAQHHELARLTLWRRILCSHRHTSGMISDDVCVQWCLGCGHTEVALAPEDGPR